MSDPLPIDTSLSGFDFEESAPGDYMFGPAYRLTKRGVAKFAVMFGCELFLSAESCGCSNPRDGDGVHIWGEPSDLICLATPLKLHEHPEASTDSTEAEYDFADRESTGSGSAA